MNLRRPRALRPGDRLAVVAPASPFPRASFEAGLAELRRLGFDPVYDERIFDVDVLKVSTMVMPAKRGRRGRITYTRHSAWKKAVVTVAPGQEIALFNA